MQYRDFGNTGKKISALGFGCMRLPEFERDGKWYIDEDKAIPMLRAAYEAGVNYFDTAVGYCHENSQYAVGKAIKPFRDKVMASTKIPMHLVKKPEDFRKVLEESLRRMDTSYIDFYHFHGINKGTFDDQIVPMKIMDEARKCIDEGLIKHISFSFHGNPDDMPYMIEKGEIISSVLLQYNLLDRSNEKAIDLLASKGIGVVVMGPVAGGRLSAPATILSEKLLDGKAIATSELAMRFVLGNKNVSCSLSGMGTMQMLTDNLKIAELEEPMTQAEWEKSREMVEQIRKFSDLYCTGCNYCIPACKKGINISHVFNAFTYHNVYGLTEHAKGMFNSIGHNEHHGKPVSDCINCGACSKKCPQNIDIPKKLKEVAELFAGL